MFVLVPADAQSPKKESATRGAWRFRAYQEQQGLGEPHSAGAETALLALRTPAQKFNPGVKGRLPDPRRKPGSQGSNAYASALTSAARARAGGFPSLIFSLGFRFGDSFALPLKHQFTLEAGESADDGEHQVTGRCAGIAEIQDAEVGPLGFHAFGDFEQMPCRARERAGNDCSMIGEELCRPRKQWRTV